VGRCRGWEDLGSVEGGQGCVVYHVQQRALDEDRRAAVPNGHLAGVVARRRELHNPLRQLIIARLHLIRLVQLLREQHHAAPRAAFLPLHALVADQDRVLRRQHVRDAQTQLGLRDAHLRHHPLRRHVAHQRAVRRQDADVVRQRRDLEVLLGEHRHVVVLVLDPRRPPHAQRHQAVPHEARPPDALPQLLLAGLHVGRLGVAVQPDGVRERDGHAHPVPGVFLVVGGFVPVGHQEEGLDEGDPIYFVVEIIENLGLLASSSSLMNMG